LSAASHPLRVQGRERLAVAFGYLLVYVRLEHLPQQRPGERIGSRLAGQRPQQLVEPRPAARPRSFVEVLDDRPADRLDRLAIAVAQDLVAIDVAQTDQQHRSEEHTSELQSRENL